MKNKNISISVILIAIVALFSMGFVSPSGTPVLSYASLLNGFYLIVAAGLAAVGLFDLVRHLHSSADECNVEWN